VGDGAMSGSVYALNLFNVGNKSEYLAYSRRSAKEVVAHGGKVIALGEFRTSVAGDIAPRQALILVEWQSKDAFDSYCRDPALADLHGHRENGTSDYMWHLFDKLEDLRPLLKGHRQPGCAPSPVNLPGSPDDQRGWRGISLPLFGPRY
jgi:uncharacterized protein (DUF1330 family)